MKKAKQKYNLPVITAQVFELDAARYELRKGSTTDAPLCPFGHPFKWIGFDKKELNYVRVTKSVFKKLILLLDPKVVEEHEKTFQDEEASEY